MHSPASRASLTRARRMRLPPPTVSRSATTGNEGAGRRRRKRLVPGSLALRAKTTGALSAGRAGASARTVRAAAPPGSGTRALEASSQVMRR